MSDECFRRLRGIRHLPPQPDDDWARLVSRVGPCLHDPKAAREPYEALVRAIGYQQLTAKAGDAIIARLKALYPDATFPTPENIIATEFDALRACGFSATKIATIKAIAEGALSGLIPLRDVAGTMDDEELIARIVTIKGIGRWTVEMLLMYSLDRVDVLPADDFGVREGYRSLKSLREQPKPKEYAKSGRRGRAPHHRRMVSLAHAPRARQSPQMSWPGREAMPPQNRVTPFGEIVATPQKRDVHGQPGHHPRPGDQDLAEQALGEQRVANLSLRLQGPAAGRDGQPELDHAGAAPCLAGRRDRCGVGRGLHDCCRPSVPLDRA